MVNLRSRFCDHPKGDLPSLFVMNQLLLGVNFGFLDLIRSASTSQANAIFNTGKMGPCRRGSLGFREAHPPANFIQIGRSQRVPIMATNEAQKPLN